MKLMFIGADHEVTGSCHYLEAAGLKILVDCGMKQGVDYFENAELPVSYSEINYVLLTHAHIDHAGMLPFIYARGFRGEIITTEATADLCNIMLKDSAHIQESEAEWKNRKARRAGRQEEVPLYEMNDAVGVLKQFSPCNYDEIIKLEEGLTIRFTDVGHLLGSASIEVWITENDISKKIVFSGDIGNKNKPLIRDPQYIQNADYVVMECTYGDRLHGRIPDHVSILADIVQRTLDRGGNVVIPAFAVGRTQELLYMFRIIKAEHMVKGHDGFEVYVDSPLAVEATNVFKDNLADCYDEETKALVTQGINPISFAGLKLSITSAESRDINFDTKPKVIISAAGMCDAGRIRHHLKHNLWRRECAIVFVGYQAEGSLGRALLEGAKSVKLFGEEIAVNARIVNFKGLSSHADRDHLLAWARHYAPKPRHTFVVHGEASVTEIFAQHLRDAGLAAHAAEYEEVYDLANDRMLAAGVPLPPKPVSAGGSPAYRKLESAGQDLLDAIRHNKGGTNKDLAQFEKELLALIQKWDR